MQQDDSLVRGQTSSSAGCQLHILSPCHLQEHPLNFLGKYKYVFVVFEDFLHFLFIISSFFTIYYSSVCLFCSSWFLVHRYHQKLFFSLWCSCISSAPCHSTKCQMSPFSVFSPDFFWFSLWLVLSCIILFLHQLGNNTHGDLLLLLLLANPWKTVLKITGGFQNWNPSPQEKSLMSR